MGDLLYLKFTDRKKLVRMFEEWATIHDVLECNESFAAWLMVKGYLNVEKIMDDFKIMKEVENV